MKTLILLAVMSFSFSALAQVKPTDGTIICSALDVENTFHTLIHERRPDGEDLFIYELSNEFDNSSGSFKIISKSVAATTYTFNLRSDYDFSLNINLVNGKAKFTNWIDESPAFTCKSSAVEVDDMLLFIKNNKLPMPKDL